MTFLIKMLSYEKYSCILVFLYYWYMLMSML